MKQICTQIALFALLLIANTSFAQTCTVASTNSGPALTSSLAVSSSTGFTSSNSNVGAFPKMQTTTLTTPAYHYNTNQSTVHFAYNFTKAQAGSTADAPVITLLYGNSFSQSVSATSTIVYNFADGTSTVYFSMTPGFTINANTDFKIRLSLTFTASDKALTANTFSTNAILTAVNGSTPLPVKFAGFYAKKLNSAIALSWNVGTEENVAGYEVQKSSDGINFSRIGFVPAAGQSSYSFTDNKVIETAYYRIKSVDNDGKYAFSSVANVKGDQSSIVLKAFPTPVQNQLTIQHSTVNNGKIEIVSTDSRMTKSMTVASGQQETIVDLSSEKAGVYFVRLVTDSNIQTLKIIRQ